MSKAAARAAQVAYDALISAVSMGGTPEEISSRCAEALALPGANVNHVDRLGCTALIRSVRYPTAVELLLAHGADYSISERDLGGKGRRPIHEAAFWGVTRSILALLTAGEDINVRDLCGATPLWTAAMVGHPETVQALLDAGADWRIKDRFDRSPEQIVSKRISKGEPRFVACDAILRAARERDELRTFVSAPDTLPNVSTNEMPGAAHRKPRLV